MSFSSLLNNSDPAIAETAGQLRTYTEEFKAGKMTQAEYKDVCTSLLNESRIKQITDDMNRQNELYAAFQQMYQIAGVIGAFAPLMPKL